MDDILVFSKTLEEHKVHIDRLMERMKEWKLYAHPEKCEFFCTQVEYLGLGIHADGVFITEASKKAIQKWQVPTPNQRNKKQNRKPNKDGKLPFVPF